MPNKEYPSPEEFKAVFGVEAKYDNDWLCFEVRLACEDNIELVFIFSVLTLEITLKIKDKGSDHLIAEIAIDRAIEIAIDEKSHELITRFDANGYRQELILSPRRRPCMKYIHIAASQVFRKEDMAD